MGGIRVFILRKIQGFARLKEVEAPIVDELSINQVLNLNQLPS